MPLMKKPLLITIVGPTAVGKTSIGIQLANHFKTEIISADSRQFYQEMEIGTAKPSHDELKRAKHHFINNLSVKDDYSVGDYEREALATITDFFTEKDLLVMVGGSGLFVDAVCYGLDDLPKVPPRIREELNLLYHHEGIAMLQEELAKLDPDYYKIVDLQNPQRLIRALEVIRATGKAFSSFRNRAPKKRPFDVLKIGLDLPREEVYQRIDRRMDQMIEAGLFEEAKRLYPFRAFNALQTVGYQEIFGFFDGDYDRAEAIRLLKRNSRRYAKRQLTWFKKDQSTKWFIPTEVSTIIEYIEEVKRS